MYKVEKGERIALAPKGTPSKTYGVKHRVPKQTWNTLSVAFQGNAFTVSFDGQKLFEVDDSTFAAAGKVGLWTKADSVTYFDDFQIESKQTTGSMRRSIPACVVVLCFFVGPCANEYGR